MGTTIVYRSERIPTNFQNELDVFLPLLTRCFCVWAAMASMIRGQAPPWGRSCPIPSIKTSCAPGGPWQYPYPPPPGLEDRWFHGSPGSASQP